MKDKFEISPWFYILAAGGILLLPGNVLTAAILAVWIHELSHLLLLCCFRVPVYKIRIGVRGIRIITGPMLPVQEVLCAAAGPLGSLALLLFERDTPYLAFFGMMQGLFNLLPVYPLDGGRILRVLLCSLFPESWIQCEQWICIFATGIIFVLVSRYISVKLAFAAALFLFLSYLIRKIPCKESAERVQ